MQKDYGYSQWFGVNLAELLSEKIIEVYPGFDIDAYKQLISDRVEGLSYKHRVELHCDVLMDILPGEYPDIIGALVQILGHENPEETGMFKNFYWVLPIGKLIEKYGLDHYDISIKAIGEVTKRNTGEYAIRPYIRKYPEQTISKMFEWSESDNFHLRRLASEGSRPKLPWATKLTEFIDDPFPVFKILENLMEDDVMFVKKSVANNITDYLKVNMPAATAFIHKFDSSENKHTRWIMKHATRKIKI